SFLSLFSLRMVCRSPRALLSFPTRRSSDLGPVDSRSGWVMTTTFWALMSPTVVAALSGLTWRVSALLPDAHAESEATENAMAEADRKSTRLNSSHVKTSYGVFCLKKKKIQT